MNLLSALPELKKKEVRDGGFPIRNEMTQRGVAYGYNECLDDLSKYSFSEEDLARQLWAFTEDDRSWNEVPDNQKFKFRAQAKELLSSLPLFLRRKEG